MPASAKAQAKRVEISATGTTTAVDSICLLETYTQPLRSSIRFLLDAMRNPDDVRQMWDEYMGNPFPSGLEPGPYAVSVLFEEYVETVEKFRVESLRHLGYDEDGVRLEVVR